MSLFGKKPVRTDPAGRVRVGVVGTGHLGSLHAKLWTEVGGAFLSGVHDTNAESAARVAHETGSRAFPALEALLAETDAISIAAPTSAHAAIAETCLGAGKHVFIEKPITATASEAERVIALAASRGLTVQVGHIERFNPAILALEEFILSPMFVESHRLSQFSMRSTDVDVVRDLMIHDLDLIRLLVPDEVVSIEAVGVPVLTASPDIANARLRFAGGCIANVTASRVSAKRERKLRLFQTDMYVAIDLGERSLRVCRRTSDERGQPDIVWEQTDLGAADALGAEVAAFLASVRTRSRPATTGEDAVAALTLCERILGAMETE